jgi:hypothetical protein
MVKGIIMKFILLLLVVISLNALAQDPLMYLNSFDSKVYSLKTKGVKEFVVDIENSKITKQINDQMIFGNVKEVIFRTYWTSSPERIAIEVIGLPEGFREIKEELKVAIYSIIDNLIPMTTAQRFAGYKFHSGATPKEFVAQDSTGIANVQSFVLKFSNEDCLTEVTGKKTIGTLITVPKYEKGSFSSGKWVLKSLTTTNSENGQSMIVKKDLKYGSSQGIGILSEVTVTTEQRSEAPGAKSLISEETVSFKNYKINAGEAMKYFLGDSSKTSP